MRKSPASTKSISAIAARVPKSAHLLELESELSALRQRRNDIADQMNAAFNTLSPDTERELRPLLHEVQSQRAAVEADIVMKRRAHAAAQREYASQVRAALEPHRAVAVDGVRAAYLAILDNWQVLDEVAAELRAAGGSGAAPEHAKAKQVALFMRQLLNAVIGEPDGKGTVSCAA